MGGNARNRVHFICESTPGLRGPCSCRRPPPSNLILEGTVLYSHRDWENLPAIQVKLLLCSASTFCIHWESRKEAEKEEMAGHVACTRPAPLRPVLAWLPHDVTPHCALPFLWPIPPQMIPARVLHTGQHRRELWNPCGYSVYLNDPRPNTRRIDSSFSHQ